MRRLIRLRAALRRRRRALGRSLIGQLTMLALGLFALGLVAIGATAEIARRATAANLADYALVDFLREEISGALAACPADDAVCLSLVYQNEFGGIWRRRGADGRAHSSLTFAVSGFARAFETCARSAEASFDGYAIATCRLEGGLAYRVAADPAPGGDLVAFELQDWERARDRAGLHLSASRGVLAALATMAAVLALLLGLALYAFRARLAALFRRLGAALDAYRAGRAARVEGAFPDEVAGLARSLNRALAKQSELLGRQRRNVHKMAHDLRHQLVAADIALRGGEPEAAAAELATLGQLVERYLILVDWVGPAEGAAATPVAPLLEGARRAFARRLRETPVDIFVEAPEGLVARAHPTDLKIILNNLVGNAHRFAAGRIAISARALPAGGVEIFVDDDGPGVPEADRARLLGWGQRLDAAPPGSGFGLAIVAEQVAELYGGAVALERSPIGGLRVVARLPDAAVVTRR